MEHHYKTWSSFWEKLGPEDKNFEVRRKRPNQPRVLMGDILVLEETKDGTKELTGRVKRADVGYVLSLSDVPELGSAQGAEQTVSINEFEVFGLYNIEVVSQPN